MVSPRLFQEQSEILVPRKVSGRSTLLLQRSQAQVASPLDFSRNKVKIHFVPRKV